MFGWYPIVPNNFWGWKNQKPFLHLSLSKAGPFTLESHTCAKAWKSNLFQIIRCLKKPWMVQILNNMNVWMVPYCAQQQVLGLKKNYFTSCDPHHDIYTFSYWQIFWHSICHIFWHSIWHIFWHIFWHSIWQIFWHIFWHSIWHCIWHIFWHIFWHILWHIFWHSIWHSI